MKNKWFTYGFLLVLVVALGSLAVLQYQWLGSVSEAEKSRLEENLSAATENFVADFNRVFNELHQSFKLQVTSKDADYVSLIGESYTTWNSAANYPALVDSIFYIKEREGGTSIFLFSTDSISLDEIKPPPAVRQWVERHVNKESGGDHSISLKDDPDLGSPSFISVPIQLLDMVSLNEEKLGRNIQVSLNLNQLDDLILIKLSDDVIKNEVIPGIAKTYLSDSFEDQFQLSIVNTSLEDSVYYSSNPSEILPVPDFKSSLRRMNFASIMVIKNKNDPKLPFTSIAFDSLKLTQISGINVNSESDKPFQFSYRKTDSTSDDKNLLWSRTRRADTTINASFLGDMNFPYWEIWLSFRAGSLDTFVNKAKTRNLLISFGILLILGISGVLIVIFSHRSRELAEQQMLFVAGVSHELRTPITVIRSAAENLSEGVVQNKQRQKEYARLMLKEGRRLSDMVDQIMEFSGIQSGKKIYQFSEISIPEFVDEIKTETASLLQEKQLRLEFAITSAHKKIVADCDALLIAVMNLIQNAIKFSREDEIINLRVDDISLNGKNAIQFSIQDFGNGIPAEEQREIFKPFFRGKKSVEEQVKGNGIGLSLVKKIAEAHQGKIQVTSKEGEGSTFRLIIPVDTHHG